MQRPYFRFMNTEEYCYKSREPDTDEGCGETGSPLGHGSSREHYRSSEHQRLPTEPHKLAQKAEQLSDRIVAGWHADTGQYVKLGDQHDAADPR